MTKNFINFHVLISHSPSCLNRDDMNMQKSAIFGGKRRVRISSQSLKRTIRQSDYYREYLGEPSRRTKQLGEYQEYVIAKLKGRFDEDLVRTAIAFISGKNDIVQDTKGDAVAPWVVEEVAYFCDKINQLKADGDVDEKKLKKAIEKDSAAFKKATAKGVDIALSGRMATSGLMTNIDGALSVAPALTTHSVDADIDWFTAVDDLQELGSGHLDTQEFSSGVFYRYASLNISQLQKNLGDATRDEALKIAAHFLHMFATETPSAKQNSFAAHNLADVALVSFSDIPISLVNAFEEPVKVCKSGGFRQPSAIKLHQHWQKLTKGFGLDERSAHFVLEGSESIEGIQKKESLLDLENWVRDDGPVDIKE